MELGSKTNLKLSQQRATLLMVQWVTRWSSGCRAMLCILDTYIPAPCHPHHWNTLRHAKFPKVKKQIITLNRSVKCKLCIYVYSSVKLNFRSLTVSISVNVHLRSIVYFSTKNNISDNITAIIMTVAIFW